MKTFIVPTDFSETSKNAAVFAAQLASSLKDTRVILYHQFDNYVPGSDGSPLLDDTEARKTIAGLALQNVQSAMQQEAGSVEISHIAVEESSFIDSIQQFVRDKMADLVIMGISDASGFEQTLFGSHALDLVSKNVCPVMIIPPHARFAGIERVAFATDYKDIKTGAPARNIHSLLDLFQPAVHVVTVDEGDVLSSPSYPEERRALELLLANYNPQYHFLKQSSFAGAIRTFVSDHEIDLIIVISKKHSMISNLFQPPHTKQLAYNSEVPVLAIHE